MLASFSHVSYFDDKLCAHIQAAFNQLARTFSPFVLRVTLHAWNLAACVRALIEHLQIAGALAPPIAIKTDRRPPLG